MKNLRKYTMDDQKKNHVMNIVVCLARWQNMFNCSFWNVSGIRGLSRRLS